MKKKISALILCAFSVVLTFACYITNIPSATYEITGRYLRTIDGTDMIFSDGPIVLSAHSNGKELFSNVKTGDEIAVRVTDIAESYPGQAAAYSCRILSEGTLDDIDYDELETVSSFGFLPSYYDFTQNADGTYTAENGITYKELKRVEGKENNAEHAGYFEVLTNNPDITYHDISWSYLSSQSTDWLNEEDTIVLWFGTVGE